MAKRRSKRTSSRGGMHSQSVYSGPVRLSNDGGLDRKSIRVNMSVYSEQFSDANGVFTNTFTQDAVADCLDWPSFAATYKEFRVLAMEVQWVNAYNATYDAAVQPSVGAICSFHTPSFDATSINKILSTSTWKPLKTGYPLKIAVKSRGFEEMQFSTGTGNPHSGVGFFVDNLTPSTFYGRWIKTFLVEFRNRY